MRSERNPGIDGIWLPDDAGETSHMDSSHMDSSALSWWLETAGFLVELPGSWTVRPWKRMVGRWSSPFWDVFSYQWPAVKLPLFPSLHGQWRYKLSLEQGLQFQCLLRLRFNVRFFGKNMVSKQWPNRQWSNLPWQKKQITHQEETNFTKYLPSQEKNMLWFHLL